MKKLWWQHIYENIQHSQIFQVLVTGVNIILTSHDGHGIPIHRNLDWLFNILVRLTSNNAYEINICISLPFYEGNPEVTSGFLSQMPSYAEGTSMISRHHHKGIRWTVYEGDTSKSVAYQLKVWCNFNLTTNW